MLVLATGFAIIVILNFLWPRALRCRIKRQPEDGGETLGQYVWVLAALFIGILYLAMVCSNPEWNWRDTEPAVGAIAGTVGVMLGYGQLISSPFFVAFEQTKGERSSHLTVPRGRYTPVKVVVHNTGITSWGTHRISLQQEQDNDGITFAPPETRTTLTIMYDRQLIQKNAGLLAVGEPSVLSFYVKAENVGDFRLRVRVVSGTRPGEKQDHSLKVKVKVIPVDGNAA